MTEIKSEEGGKEGVFDQEEQLQIANKFMEENVYGEVGLDEFRKKIAAHPSEISIDAVMRRLGLRESFVDGAIDEVLSRIPAPKDSDLLETAEGRVRKSINERGLRRDYFETEGEARPNAPLLEFEDLILTLKSFLESQYPELRRVGYKRCQPGFGKNSKRENCFTLTDNPTGKVYYLEDGDQNLKLSRWLLGQDQDGRNGFRLFRHYVVEGIWDQQENLHQKLVDQVVDILVQEEKGAIKDAENLNCTAENIFLKLLFREIDEHGKLELSLRDCPPEIGNLRMNKDNHGYFVEFEMFDVDEMLRKGGPKPRRVYLRTESGNFSKRPEFGVMSSKGERISWGSGEYQMGKIPHEIRITEGLFKSLTEIVSNDDLLAFIGRKEEIEEEIKKLGSAQSLEDFVGILDEYKRYKGKNRRKLHQSNIGRVLPPSVIVSRQIGRGVKVKLEDHLDRSGVVGQDSNLN